MKTTKAVFVSLLIIMAAPLWADDLEDAEKLEAERQEIFQTGFEFIVESMNLGSIDVFVANMNASDFLNRVYGLRLINPGVKKSFSESMANQFPSLIREGFRDGFGNSQVDIKGKLLGVESRGIHARAVVRYDWPNMQFGYHEYELKLDDSGRIVIVDWLDYYHGDSYSDSVGTGLVVALPSEAAVRKLIDFKDPSPPDLFQYTELLKAARDKRDEKYLELLSGLNPALQRQHLVLKLTVQLAKQVNNRRFLRVALMQMAEHAPEEPLFSLMLLDYYVPSHRFDLAIEALQRTYDKLGFEDAAMEARLSAITLAKGNAADANAYAERAILMEPQLELGWWSALRARVGVADFAAAVAALQHLEEHFGHELGAEQLKGDKAFAPLLASDEFKSWDTSR